MNVCKQKLPIAPRHHHVGFNLIKHTRLDVFVAQLPRPGGQLPPFMPIVSKQSGPTVGSPFEKFCLPMGSPLGSARKAPEVTHASRRVQNCWGPTLTKFVQRPAPGPGPTVDTTMAESMQTSNIMADMPRPQLPPKPNLSQRSAPLISPQSINRLATTVTKDLS
jgi:hypothetical protein